MKKGLMIIFLIVLVTSFIPSSAEAVSIISISSNVRFFPCIAEDGSYKLTITVAYPMGVPLGGAANGVNGFTVNGFNVRIRQDGGQWFYYPFGQNGLTLKYGGLPEGTTFDVQDYFLYGVNGISSPLGFVEPFTHSIKLQGKDYPACFEKCSGNPLFKMYVLTRPDSYCLIISDVHPSVESQKALCFPGTDWVATNTACEGWVCDNDCWDCDYLGFLRLTLKDLWHIYERRQAQGLSQ